MSAAAPDDVIDLDLRAKLRLSVQLATLERHVADLTATVTRLSRRVAYLEGAHQP